MTSYIHEQSLWQKFKVECTEDILNEYAIALKTVIQGYNTSIRENRFIVGGAIEFFTTALIRSTGISITHMSTESKSYDLLLPNGKGISIKSELTGKGGVILKNIQGNRDVNQSDWDVATFFILSGVGIVYADPSMVGLDDFSRRKDALMLNRAFLNKQSENPKWVLNIDFPNKPSIHDTGKSKIASIGIAIDIIEKNGLTRLQTFADNPVNVSNFEGQTPELKKKRTHYGKCD